LVNSTIPYKITVYLKEYEVKLKDVFFEEKNALPESECLERKIGDVPELE